MKTNKKYTVDRPELSSDRINSMQDFDSVMKGAQGGGVTWYKSKLFLASAIILVIAGWTTWALLATDSDQLGQIEENKPETTMPRTQEDPEDKVRKPLVVPPVNEWDIPFSEHRLSADKGGMIQLENGTLIQVPKTCLLNQNGERVSGEVTFKYREMHKSAEFALSGIPMTYDSAGMQFYFQSAGMCELRAFQNGQELVLDKQKPIAINMNTTKRGVYNLYHLDEETKNWSARGATREMQTKLDVPQNTNSVETVNKEVPDRQTAVSLEVAEKESKLAQIQKGIKQLKKKKPVAPKKADASRPQIKLEILPEEFPELAGFTEVKFEVAKEDKSFKPEFFQVIWNDIELKRFGDGKFEMTLIKDEGEKTRKVKLIVYPVFEGRKLATAQANYEKMLAEYTSKLKKRKAEEADALAQLEEQKRLQEEEAKKRQDLQQKRAQAMKSGDDFYRSAYGEIRRNFTMNKFGVWNSDNPKQFSSRSKSKVFDFKIKGEEEFISPQLFQLINNDALMVHYVFQAPKGNIKYRENDQNLMFAVNPDGYLLYNFRQNWETSGSWIELEKSESKFKSASEVVAFIDKKMQE